MLKKTLIATAAAGMIAAGAMVGTASTASAASFYFGAPGFGFRIGHPYRYGHRVCHPVFRIRRWFDRYGRPHHRRVIVGRRCHWTYGRDYYGHHRYHHHWHHHHHYYH